MNTTFLSSSSQEDVLAGLPLSKKQRVDLSADEQSHMDSLMTQALTIAHNTPDIRQERIDAIRARIENGEYEIDVDRIAECLIRENPALFEEWYFNVDTIPINLAIPRHASAGTAGKNESYDF